MISRIYAYTVLPALKLILSISKQPKNLENFLHKNTSTLINGAGCLGLMCRISDAALAAGGTVTGVIPRFMVEQGWHHKGLDPANRNGKHARTQTTYGRFVRRSHCPARRMRYTRRTVGNHYLKQLGLYLKTHRYTEYQRIL